MKELSVTDIIGMCLGLIAVICVYSSEFIARKVWKDDSNSIHKYSLIIKISSFFLALIAFVLVVVF